MESRFVKLNEQMCSSTISKQADRHIQILNLCHKSRSSGLWCHVMVW